MAIDYERLRRALPRHKRADLIVEEIKRWIVAGRLKPGDRLPRESELIDILQSSRGTVREALKVLESQGLVKVARGAAGGARISSVSYGTASQALRNYLYFQTLTWSDVYRIREKIEPIVALAAADSLTPGDVAALRETVALCRRGLAGKCGTREHRIAELEFHAILARACADPMLRFLGCFITDLLRDLTFSDARGVFGQRQVRFARAAVRYHAALIDAYEARDRGRVQQLMAEHMHDAGCIVSQREARLDRAVLMSRAAREEWLTTPWAEPDAPAQPMAI